MTDKDRLLLNDLKTNIQQIFKSYNELEIKKKLLEKKVENLVHEIESLKQEKSELSQKNEHLKIANHILSGTDENMEAKKKINKLIREIDKCIALLNE